MDIIPFPGSEETAVAEGDNRQATVLRAVDAAAPHATPGHVFTLAWLEDAFGLGDKPSDTEAFERWNTQRIWLIGAFVDEMLKSHHIHVENRPGRGYVVIAPDDTPFVAVKIAQREMRRAIQAASEKVQCTPDGLTDRQRQDRMDALAYLGRAALAIGHQRPKPPRPGRRVQTAG